MSEVTTLILGSAFTLVGALAGILVQFFLSERAQQRRSQEERSQELAEFDDQLIREEFEPIRVLLSDILDHLVLYDAYVRKKTNPQSSEEDIRRLDRQIGEDAERLTKAFRHAVAQIKSLPYQKLSTDMDYIMTAYYALTTSVASEDLSNFHLLKNSLTLVIARMYANIRQYRRLVMRGEETVILPDWDEEEAKVDN